MSCMLPVDYIFLPGFIGFKHTLRTVVASIRNVIDRCIIDGLFKKKKIKRDELEWRSRGCFFCGWTTRSRFPHFCWHQGTNPSLHGNFPLHAVKWYRLIGRFSWIQLLTTKNHPIFKPGTKKNMKGKTRRFFVNETTTTQEKHIVNLFLSSIIPCSWSIFFSCLVDKVKSWSLVWEVGLKNHGFRWDLFLVPREKKHSCFKHIVAVNPFRQGCTAQRLGPIRTQTTKK